MLTGHGGWVLGVDFTPDRVILGHCRTHWDRPAVGRSHGRQVLVLSGHSGFVGDVDISPDGTILATGGLGTVRLWDISPAGPREQATIAGRSNVQSLAYSPDGKWLATTSLDGYARSRELGIHRTEGSGCSPVMELFT